MDSVRCVIAGIPQKLLADIVQIMAEESGGMEIVARVGSIKDVPAVIDRMPVDVLILGMENIELSALNSAALGTMANLPIVGLGNDGRKLVAYLDNVGKNEILRIINAVSRANREAM